MTLLVDGQRASAVDGLHLGYAERLAAHPDPTGCVDCGGPAPLGSALTLVDRSEVHGALMSGRSAWRRCGDCVEERRRGAGAVARSVLEVHGLGVAERATPETISAALRACGLPRWCTTSPGGEEFAPPVERWGYPAAARWAGRFRDWVRVDLGGWR